MSKSWCWQEGFPGGSLVKNPPANSGDVGSIPGWEDPLEEEMATSIFLPGESHGQRSRRPTVHRVVKESDTI